MGTKSESLLQGAVDFHLHASPDPYRERSADACEVARQAKACGMKGVVLKSQTYPTAPLAQMIKKAVPGIEVIGGLVLNREMGGINPAAVEVSAKLGGKVLWMPTTSAVAVRKRKGYRDGIAILGAEGTVSPETEEVLALVKEFDLVLCTGHLLPDEILPLFAQARKMGIGKFVLTHALKLSGTFVDLKTQKALADQGAFIEHCFLSTMPDSGNIDPARIVEAIRFVGAGQCLLSTDFGKINHPPPGEGMRDMLDTFSRAGLSRHEIDLLVKTNPSRLLDI